MRRREKRQSKKNVREGKRVRREDGSKIKREYRIQDVNSDTNETDKKKAEEQWPEKKKQPPT